MCPRKYLGVSGLAGSLLLALGCAQFPTEPSNLRFVSITAGSSHTCALTESGEAYCWGGQGAPDLFLPTGPKISHPRPTAVAGELRFTALSSSSGDRTCGITATGAAYCWDARLTPTPVSGGVSFASLATGDDTTCGLDADHVAYCWGDNNSLGQLATGSFAPDVSASPRPIIGSLQLTHVATSAFGYSCGLTSAGVAYCWGQNAWGQLGDGTETKRNVPVAVSGGLSFVALSTGWVHTCGLTSAGAAWCWGAGQQVNGKTYHILTPVAVSGDLTFRTISAGEGQTCGLTLEGSAYCWGRDPAPDQAVVPTAVPGGLIFTKLTTGGRHACGLAIDGRAYCWGANVLGQLGDGTVTESSAPVLVAYQ